MIWHHRALLHHLALGRIPTQVHMCFARAKTIGWSSRISSSGNVKVRLLFLELSSHFSRRFSYEIVVTCRQRLNGKWKRMESITRTSFSAGNQSGCITTFLIWFFSVIQRQTLCRKWPHRSSQRKNVSQRTGSVTFLLLSGE